MRSKILVVALLTAVFMTISIGAGLAAVKSGILQVGKDIFIGAGESVSEAVAIGGNITVAGSVDNDVVAIGGYVNLKPGASVGGDVVSVGGNIIRAKGTIVGGEIREIATIGFAPFTNAARKMGLSWLWGGSIALRMLSLFAFLALAAILVVVFSSNIGNASSAANRGLWRSFLVGLVGMLLFVPITALLLISIIGIPLIPLWMLVFAAAVIMGYITVSAVIGKRMLVAAGKKNSPMIGEVLLGLVVFGLVGFIPVIGWTVKSAATAIGLGGVILTRFGVNKLAK